MHVLVPQSCLNFCDPLDYVTYQAPLSMVFSRQEYWSGLPFPSRGSSCPRDQTWVSYITGRFFTIWATREAHQHTRNIRTWDMNCWKTLLNFFPCLFRDKSSFLNFWIISTLNHKYPKQKVILIGIPAWGCRHKGIPGVLEVVLQLVMMETFEIVRIQLEFTFF